LELESKLPPKDTHDKSTQLQEAERGQEKLRQQLEALKLDYSWQEHVCQQKLQNLRRNIEEHGRRMDAEAMRSGGLVGQHGDALINVSRYE
jgi:chromosome segregation ATPase